ncbi:hypothetical protein GE09DRAFT_1143788 [Coniochaeta sp. 2T2.1]|nr:hypothetical protein GE09DRAFT_1143788 [Coniochaeta sp. 2T2.1]
MLYSSALIASNLLAKWLSTATVTACVSASMSARFMFMLEMSVIVLVSCQYRNCIDRRVASASGRAWVGRSCISRCPATCFGR